MSRLSGLLGAATLSCALIAPASSLAAPAPHGPDPTPESVRVNGPYAVSKIAVPDRVTSGFGSATISYPTTTTEGKFGVVAVSPGFTGPESSIAWYGPALASQGFVVITFNTSTPWDFPTSRATQLLRALDYVTATSAVKGRVDPTRTAVVGHSMGGGGAIDATTRRPALKAAVGLTPWSMDKTTPEDRSPTLIVSAENDGTASVAQHASPLYRGIPLTTPKAHATLAGAGHLAPISKNAAIQGLVVSWLKRFVDEDARYTSLVCPDAAAAPAASLNAYVSTCGSWG